MSSEHESYCNIKHEQVSSSFTEEKSSSQHSVHLLPCKIDYNGVAPVKAYFRPEKDLTTEQYIAHFRGRRLVGQDIILPENVIMKHALLEHPTDNAGERSLELVHDIKKFTIWQHDTQPDISSVQDCLDWIEICNAVSFDSIFSKYSSQTL